MASSCAAQSWKVGEPGLKCNLLCTPTHIGVCCTHMVCHAYTVKLCLMLVLIIHAYLLFFVIRQPASAGRCADNVKTLKFGTAAQVLRYFVVLQHKCMLQAAVVVH